MSSDDSESMKDEGHKSLQEHWREFTEKQNLKRVVLSVLAIVLALAVFEALTGIDPLPIGRLIDWLFGSG